MNDRQQADPSTCSVTLKHHGNRYSADASSMAKHCVRNEIPQQLDITERDRPMAVRHPSFATIPETSDTCRHILHVALSISVMPNNTITMWFPI